MHFIQTVFAAPSVAPPAAFFAAAYTRFLESVQSAYPEVGFVASSQGAKLGMAVGDASCADSLHFVLLYPGAKLQSLPGRSLENVFLVKKPGRVDEASLRTSTLRWRVTPDGRVAGLKLAGFHVCGGELSSRRHPPWEICL